MGLDGIWSQVRMGPDWRRDATDAVSAWLTTQEQLVLDAINTSDHVGPYDLDSSPLAHEIVTALAASARD